MIDEEMKHWMRQRIKPLLKQISNDMALYRFRKNSSFFIGKPKQIFQCKGLEEFIEEI